MKSIKWLIFALGVAISGAALARLPVAIIDFPDQPVVTASGNGLTVEQVQEAIRKAASEKKWVVGSNPNGTMLASLSWNNNKHTIMVEITASPDRYSLKYNNSINMNYGRSRGDYDIPYGQPIIHPYYNRFVGELRDGIRLELMKH